MTSENVSPYAHRRSPEPQRHALRVAERTLALAPREPTVNEHPTAPHSGRPRLRHGVSARGKGTRRGDLVIAAAGVGLGVSIGIGVVSVRGGLQYPGGIALAIGTVCALAGTYLCLALLLLISRMPWLEREVGHDRMVYLHRKVAPYSLVLIALHVVFTTLSYAQSEQHGFLAQTWDFVVKSQWGLPAAVAFVMMIGLGFASARPLRTRMKYETWWVSHLYFYLAVALSFGHQLVLSPMFAGHPVQRWYWSGLFIFVGLVILSCRVLIPVATSLKHDLKVAAVVPESDGVVSVYLSGRDLDLLKARGGQFFQWRFVTRHWWWQAHPYSLSASPNPSWLRITVKDLGDQSSVLSELHPGTRVLVEGPYGVFTAASRHGESVTAFAAGVGITPIRAVLDDLPHDTEVTVVYRVADAACAPLSTEIEELVAHRGWTLHLLAGSRAEHPLTAADLEQLVPHLAESDVYICGPTEFADSVRDGVSAAGVPAKRIHHESFAF